VNLVKSITKIDSKGFYRNLFHIFLSLIVFSTYFRSSYEFLEFLNQMKNWKSWCTELGRLQPEAWHCWPSLAEKTARDSTVAHSPTALWRSVGGNVLPYGMRGRWEWHRARWGGEVRTVEGCWRWGRGGAQSDGGDGTPVVGDGAGGDL
jgi:hypothetical protein